MIGDLIAVWSSDTGVPRSFEMSGHRYLVCGRPKAWIDYAPWWSLTAETPLTSPQQPMWRLTGMDRLTGQTVQVDLAVEEPHWWRVTSIDK
ncbi:MAG: hypothetical protein LBE83_10705 [Propionibacteriaceae bacterium]|jgi:hypothetical protein|nr:hypothetical protein [Propionibacteriaceae bacterium]